MAVILDLNLVKNNEEALIKELNDKITLWDFDIKELKRDKRLEILVNELSDHSSYDEVKEATKWLIFLAS